MLDRELQDKKLRLRSFTPQHTPSANTEFHGEHFSRGNQKEAVCYSMRQAQLVVSSANMFEMLKAFRLLSTKVVCWQSCGGPKGAPLL